jgi:hypothetical protein
VSLSLRDNCLESYRNDASHDNTLYEHVHNRNAAVKRVTRHLDSELGASPVSSLGVVSAGEKRGSGE